MARGEPKRTIVAGLAICVALTLGYSGLGAARAEAVGVTFKTRPGLQPAFDPAVTDYVTRCEPRERVRVSVLDGSGTPVSVDRQSARFTSFSTRLQLAAGERFTVKIGATPGGRTYSIRCLPYDFPAYSVQRPGQPQAAYYLLTIGSAMTSTPLPYAVLFDNHGVPVWWYQELNGVPTNASLLPNGNLAWEVNLGTSFFGAPAIMQWEEHRLDGTLVRTLQTQATLPDSPEPQPLSNGDFLITGYAPREAALAPLGFVGTTPVLDATFREVSPNGIPIYSWDSNGRISPAESERWFFAWQSYPGVSGLSWDTQHITSIEPDGDGYLVAMDHTDAVYLIRRSDGAVEWKLGGTTTQQSLTILGDPYASTDFGGPHDARVLPDGTISVLDNATFQGVVVPRVLRFRIDTDARTATLVQQIEDPAVTSSTCCGSARLLPGGDWVVDWGGTQTLDEFAPDGSVAMRLTLASPYYSYRAVPLLPGQVKRAQLVTDMDRMYPRAPTKPGNQRARRY